MWKQQIQKKDPQNLRTEINKIQENNSIALIEKELKLGFLYYCLDCLAAAQVHFRKIVNAYYDNINNKEFLLENEKGINILFRFKIIPDGCGGWDIVESGCGVDVCQPFCCCLGIITVMACCGISADQITTCDTTDGQGCLDNCLNGCCGWCCDDCC